jgi:hypothetical protein
MPGCTSVPLFPVLPRSWAEEFDEEPEGGLLPEPFPEWRLETWASPAHASGKVAHAPGAIRARRGWSGALGGTFEVRAASPPDADGPGWSSAGFLYDHFQGSVSEGGARAEGLRSGVMVAFGPLGGPFLDARGRPEEFAARLEILGGIRAGSVRVRLPAPGGRKISDGSSWPEAALGLRVAVHPLPWCGVFARADAGVEIDAAQILGSEEEPKGSRSFGLVAGVRLRLGRNAGFEAGWRVDRLEGGEVSLFPYRGRETATVIWSGLWAGIEVRF